MNHLLIFAGMIKVVLEGWAVTIIWRGRWWHRIQAIFISLFYFKQKSIQSCTYPQTWNSTKNIVLINYIPEVWNSLIVAWNPNSPSKPCRQNVNHTKCDFWIFAPFSDWDPKDSYHSCCISNILHDSDCFHINLVSLEKVEFYLKKGFIDYF